MTIEPRYRSEQVTLYCADCLDVLPQLEQVDAVITDPVWPNAPNNIFGRAINPVDLLGESLSMIRAKRLVIVLRYDSDPRFLIAVPIHWKFFRVQTMEYRIPGYNGRKLGGQEYAYSFGDPIPSADGQRVIPGNGPKVQKTEDNGHPAPRSIDHFRWLIHWWSMPGETVLDPFMGSGTTGIACLMMTDRHFIGIEIDPTYYAIAEKRIRQAELQIRMPI